MILDSRIRRLPKDYFRYKLTLEDVKDLNNETVIEVISNISTNVGHIEKAVIFVNNPVVVPHFPYSKYRKIMEGDEDELRLAIGHYLFLNPTIGTSGLLKMADFISRNNLQYIGDIPSFDHDYVIELCNDMHYTYPYGDFPIIESNKVILFQNFSKLSPAEKKAYSNKYRKENISYLWGEIIHSSAVYTIENTPKHMVIYKRHILESSKELNDDDKISRVIRSVDIYNKYIEDRTTELLDYESMSRFIKERSYDKWNRFLDLYDKKYTNREIAKEVNISLTTVVEWKRYAKIYLK